MKNVYLLLCAGIFSRTSVSAQAYVGQTDKAKVPQAAAGIRLPFNADRVESALKTYLSHKGYSSSNVHGFILFRGVPLQPVDSGASDLYFATETPDRKEKDMTVLTLLPSKRDQDMNGLFVDSSKLDAARIFLDSLAPFVNTYGIGLQANDQQEALSKAQKKMVGLVNDSTDYEKRLRDLQQDLAENQADQVKAASDLKTYIGDSDNKTKYQKRLNNLIDREGTLQKKIRNTQGDLADKKSDIIKQQTTIDGLRQALDATKARQN